MRDQTVLSTAVRSYYDMQKLRIQIGNRITASFRDKLGLQPSQAEEEDEEAAKLLDQLRAEYKLITNGVTRITRNKKSDSKLLTSPAEIELIGAYEKQLNAEAAHMKIIDWALDSYPIWTEFLKCVRGVGPLMAGVIISEVDITKCNSMSALHKYCGIDVVVVEREDGSLVGEGRSKRANHLVPKQYTNRDGKITETRGITYNPFLKTKLVGVLGGCFIKSGGKYKDIYNGVKFRYQNRPDLKDRSKAHIHAMANRYMIKMFLNDVWTKWRELEGLEVRGSYAEDKLGIVHHAQTQEAA